MTRAAAVGVALVLLLGGCGDDDDGGGGSAGRDLAQRLEDAVAATEAAKTARMEFDIAIEGPESASFEGDALVDFEHDRDLVTVTTQGRTVQLFNDRGEEYVRQGTSGRYRPLPASEQSPVVNDPAGSLKYVGTDVVDVREGADEGCLEGDLDFDRVFARVKPGQEGALPEDLRGVKAPVVVCVDESGRIERYDVEFTYGGFTADIRTTISDHGRTPALDPLGPDERPRG